VVALDSGGYALSFLFQSSNTSLIVASWTDSFFKPANLFQRRGFLYHEWLKSTNVTNVFPIILIIGDIRSFEIFVIFDQVKRVTASEQGDQAA
jgi:hypothetical protein